MYRFRTWPANLKCAVNKYEFLFRIYPALFFKLANGDPRMNDDVIGSTKPEVEVGAISVLSYRSTIRRIERSSTSQ